MKHFRKMQISLALVLLIMAAMMLGSTAIIYADGEIPYTFSPGQTISSSQVNANFQALSAKIAELQAQLAPVVLSPASVAGIYDYFLFGTSTDVVGYNASDYEYRFGRTNYQGTLVLYPNGTSKLNGAGGYTQMAIRNIIYEICGDCPYPYTDHRQFSKISGTLSTDRPTDIGEATYTVNGFTVTVGGGVFVGTLSSDLKMLAGIFKSPYDNGTGIMIGIRRPPAPPIITSATSATADGWYKAGDSINITLNFSEAVTSTGLTITLNSYAAITTGAISNAPGWSGTYTVGAGQASSDLSISSITGIITSVINTSFSTSNPMPPSGLNIGDSKAIVIE